MKTRIFDSVAAKNRMAGKQLLGAVVAFALAAGAAVSEVQADSREQLRRALGLSQSRNVSAGIISVRRTGTNQYELWNMDREGSVIAQVSVSYMRGGTMMRSVIPMEFGPNSVQGISANVVEVLSVQRTGYVGRMEGYTE